jgi:hypothetical protein
MRRWRHATATHAACAKLLRTARELLLPAPVLVELDYFLTELTSSHRAFDEVLRRIENGVFTSGSSTPRWSRWRSGNDRPESQRSTVATSARSSHGTSRRSSCSRRSRPRPPRDKSAGILN